MANTRRIPFVLNLDDPVDAAIWEALQPLLERRRASQFIRGAVAHALGVSGLLSPIVMPTTAPNGHHPKALPAGNLPKAKRPTPAATLDSAPIEDDPDDSDALDQATDNFLSMFG
jgi:hypothetical protein